MAPAQVDARTGSARTHHTARRKLRQRLERAGLSPEEIAVRVEALRIAQRLREPPVLAKSLTRRQRLAERDLGLCRYCGVVTLEPGEGRPMQTVDHMLPVSRGGSNDFTNLVIACFACNHRKRDRTPEEAGMPVLPIGTTAEMLKALAVFFKAWARSCYL